jgi:hypothetical protein
MLHLPPHSKNFLIPPSTRRKFLLRFTLFTVCGWFVATIARIAVENILLGNHLTNIDAFPWVKILCSIIFAVIFAADQALVLGSYISPKLWILATTIGWLLLESPSINWVKYLFPQLTLTGVLSTILYICSGICLGLCQWLVLRRYAKSPWVWIFQPSLCFLVISLFTLLPQNLIPKTHHTPILYWSEQSLKAIILGVIPGFCLCSFKKNPHYSAKISSSSYFNDN